MEKYEIIKQRFDKVYDQIQASVLRGKVFPEESKLRLSLPLKDGKGQYIFNIKDTNATGPKDISLDRNDVFVINNWAVMLGIENTTTGQEKLYTFSPINDGTHPSIFEAGFTQNQIDKLWDGYLQWLLDNQVMLSTYPMEKFHKVPRTQGAFVLDSNNEAVQEGIQTERNLDHDLELVIPKYIIAGTRDHKITVNFDAANLTFPVTTGYKANLVLLMEGFLVKGGCQNIDGNNPFGDAVGNW